MITFVPMSQDDFIEYRSYSNDFRSKELAEEKCVSMDQALVFANDELNECLPHGPETKDNYLMCINRCSGETKYLVGYFWYALTSDAAYIYDFHILTKYRNKGYGRQVFKMFRSKLSTKGVERIDLLVAYGNERAFNLYSELGFQATGINMSMRLSHSQSV